MIFPLIIAACSAALIVLIPKLSEAIHTDSEIEVVNEALDCLTELLKELKGLALKSEGHRDAILMCIKNVFNKAVSGLKSSWFHWINCNLIAFF